ncbi:MAG: DNA primase [Candidatus Zixiibacteriota bacterium]
MAFSQQTLEQIREQVSIVDIVSQFTTLKLRGGRHVGLCPFHSEKTPSFSVDEGRGLYHCFGCGRGGDLFTFVQEAEGLSFNEAVERLANHAGIEIRKQRPSEKGLSEAFNVAQKFYTSNLKSPEGKAALEYLKNRGISEKLAIEFGLGFAPKEWDSFYKYARKKGIKDNDLHKTGLIKTSSIGKPIDFYINGITIPIHNRSGRVIGFGMRNLGDEGPKYVNSPEHPLYKKSSTLFGFSYARKDIRKNEIAYITEGYFDAISLWERGYRNVIAGCGTALTQKQAFQIKRLTNRAVIFYDGDSAGKAATLKAIPILLRAGIETRVLELPDNEDPDSFARSSSPEVLVKYMSSHLDFFEYITKIGLQQDIPKSVPEKMKALGFFKPFINAVDDSLNKSMYIANLADILRHPRDEVERVFHDRSFENQKRSTNRNRNQDAKQPIKKDRAKESELLMISYILCNNRLIEFIGKINPFVFYRGIFEEIRDIYYDIGKVTLSDISGILADKNDKSFIGKCIFNADDEKIDINFTKSLLQNQIHDIQKKQNDIKSRFESGQLNDDAIAKYDKQLRTLDKKKMALFKYLKDPYKLLEFLQNNL